MVHKVVAEVDAGKPLVIREVEIREGDSLDDLEARMHGVSAIEPLFSIIRWSAVPVADNLGCLPEQVEHEIIVDGARVILESLST
jgi:hypothetical protein